MATITELQERLALYRQAEQSILSGHQEYRIGTQSYTRADLETIRQTIEALEHRLAVAQRGGRLSHAVAIFGGRR